MAFSKEVVDLLLSDPGLLTRESTRSSVVADMRRDRNLPKYGDGGGSGAVSWGRGGGGGGGTGGITYNTIGGGGGAAPSAWRDAEITGVGMEIYQGSMYIPPEEFYAAPEEPEVPKLWDGARKIDLD